MNSTKSCSDIIVSFIIPHKGRFDMLKQTLRSIELQDFPKEKIEVIVVSQTPDIVNQTLIEAPLNEGSQISLLVLSRPDSDTISTSRNYGVKQAQGAYLAFLDADIFLSSNWLEQMFAHLQDNNRIIVSAKQICDDNAPPLEKIRTHLSNAELDCNVAFLPGRNLFMRRSSFEQIGGFPEHLITCEDYYFTDQASKLGPLFYTSAATYIHLGEDKFYDEMFKKEIWRGQSNLQSIQGRNIPLREIPSFIIPIGIFACLLLAIICLVLQFHWPAWIFLLLSLLPVLAYSVRLFMLAKSSVGFGSVFTFYLYYFPARAIGTLAGVFKSINANHK